MHIAVVEETEACPTWAVLVEELPQVTDGQAGIVGATAFEHFTETPVGRTAAIQELRAADLGHLIGQQHGRTQGASPASATRSPSAGSGAWSNRRMLLDHGGGEHRDIAHPARKVERAHAGRIRMVQDHPHKLAEGFSGPEQTLRPRGRSAYARKYFRQ